MQQQRTTTMPMTVRQTVATRHLAHAGLAMLAALALVACAEPGSGDWAERAVDLSGEPVRAVESPSNVELVVVVEPGLRDPVRARVHGDDNLIDDVSLDLRGSTLVVDTEHDVAPELPLVVELAVPELQRVLTSGSGDIRVDGRITELLVEATGSADVHLTGKLGAVEIYTSGSGGVLVDRLAGGYAIVEASGSGDAELLGAVSRVSVVHSGSGDVHAGSLDATVGSAASSGSGDVRVCVSGELDVARSGSGQVQNRCR